MVYVGSHKGLSIWDGETWKLHKTPQESRVRSLTYWNDDRIYVGITNDVGYFHKNKSGKLQYYSLIENWDDKKSKFGSVWSVAAMDEGVVFSSKKHVLFWDGESVQIIDDAQSGSFKLFSIGGEIYYKHKLENNLKKITFNQGIRVESTPYVLPEKSIVKHILLNNNNKLVIFTASHGIFLQNEQALKQVNNLSNFPDNIKISSAIQTSDNYYFVLSKYQGLIILDQNFTIIKQYKDENVLGSNVLFNMMQDDKGFIWLVGEPTITQLMPPHHLSYYQTEFKSKVTENMKLIANQVIIVGDSAYQLQPGTSYNDPAEFKHIAKDRNKMWDLIRYKDYALFSGIDGIYAAEISRNNDIINHKKILDMPYSANMQLNPSKDSVYVVTDNGLYRFSLNGDQWESQHYPQIDDDLHYLVFDDAQNLWATTSKQIVYRINNLENDKPLIIKKFDENDGIPPYSFKPNKLSQGLVFNSSIGLMDFDQNRTPHFQLVTPYPSVFTNKEKGINLLYENNNSYWYSTDSHIGQARLTDTNNWQINENVFNIVPNGGFRAFVISAPNILWISMYNGDIYRLNTQKFDSLPIESTLNIRQIINKNTDKELFGGFGTTELNELEANENTMRINYALSDIGLNSTTLYRYKLMGLNQQWSQWSNENYIDFTSLNGKNYTFQIEAKDIYNRVYNTQFQFKIKPMWYMTTVAKWIYAFITLLFLAMTGWFAQKWRTKKLTLQNLILQKLVDEKTSELVNQQEQKDRFFANVSHEFRTPLTLTIAPLKAIIDNSTALPENVSHSINTAIRNANKMLSLVGQILDINRLESGKLPLRVAEYNVTELMNNLSNRFKPWCNQNQQELIDINLQEPVLLYFDQDQIDKCLSNLLSNAIKYSGHKSKIEIEIIHKGDKVGLRIADDGVGIKPEFEDKIFQRYFQDINSEQVSHPGTGIGLALVKELIELHHGTIELTNNYNKGCQFILWLKRGKKHFDKSQFIESMLIEKNQINDIPEMNSLIISNNNSSSGNNTTILVVDDNTELLHFISSMLSNNFNILQAKDGKQGLAIATTSLPDLIVSDVMMPVMDGYELTKRLKTQNITKLIPIILLTAKSQKREIVEGLNTGADDYLSKPFDTSELIARITGILNNRKLIRETIQFEFSNQANQLKTSHNFADQINKILLENLSKPDLNTEKLANLLSMSRQTLNRKCKKEFEQSTVQYINKVRMQHAFNLIKTGKYSVSEVAYGTGYESLAYFSKLFKKHFGQSPSSLKK